MGALMQLDSKTQKIHNVIKYKAYTALIEGKINQEQYEMLTEIGFLDKIKSFFGGGVDVGKDLAKLFKNKTAQRQLNTAKENITKAIQDLRDIASKAGVDESAVNEFLQGVLKGADVNPSDVASVAKQSGEAEKAATPGETVTTQVIEKNPEVITKIVSDVTGQDAEKVGAEIEKKKPDVAAISAVLGNAIGQEIKVDGKIATTVIKALIDKGHLKLENGSPLTVSGLSNLITEVKSLNEQAQLLARWQLIAGVNGQLDEASKNALSYDISMAIMRGEIKTAEDLSKYVMGLAGPKLSAEEQLKLIELLPEEGAKPEKDVNVIQKKVEKIAPETKQELPPENKPSEQEVKAAEKSKEQYGKAFTDIRAVVKPEEANDVTLVKIIDKINSYKSVKVAA